MTRERPLTPAMAALVERTCFSFAAQRAARALGRRYDAALRPSGLSNWQFTLLMMLLRDDPPTIGVLAQHLATDRTTITANLKPLERRGLVLVQNDPSDARVRRVMLSENGRDLISEAYPLWQRVQDDVARLLSDLDQETFRTAAAALST